MELATFAVVLLTDHASNHHSPMKSARLRTAAVVCLDVALLGVCFLHLPSVLHRPHAPFSVVADSSGVVIDTVTNAHEAGAIALGDRLLSWKGRPIRIPEAVEFFTDFESVGAQIPVTVMHDGIERHLTITLVPFYRTPRFVLTMFFVGFLTWVVAVLILLKARPGLPARVLHWTLIALAVALLVTPGPISPDSVMTHLVRSIFVLSYPSLAVLFFFFTLLYPRAKIRVTGATSLAVFGPLVILVAGLWYTGTRAIMGESSVWFERHQLWFDLLHTSVLAYTLAAIGSIWHSIARSAEEDHRRHLLWIVYGVSVGVGPYLLFHILPQILWSTYLLPEEYAVVFLLAIPYSFLVSLVRDRLLDVQLTTSRKVLSIAMRGMLTLIFVLASMLGISLVYPTSHPFGEHLLLVTVALGIALLLNPARVRVQHIVDETLFAARFRFRRSIGEIGSKLQQSLTARQVFSHLTEGLSKLVPADVLSTYRYTQRPPTLVMVQSTVEGVPGSIRLGAAALETLVAREVQGLKGSLDATRRDRELERLDCLEGTGFAVCVPIASDDHELLGAILIKPRGGRDRLQEEEIDLLVSLAREASEVLGRLRLQEQIILGEEEKRRIQVLSELKSDFVSYVSHELFTPLTSMSLFTELLAERLPRKDRKGHSYLRIVRGEAGRLARMVKTILNTARFDSGATVFHRSSQDLVRLTRAVIDSMAYQLEMHRFSVRTTFPRGKLMIDADPEGVTLAISNIISNAIKYSPKRKSLLVRLRRSSGWAACEVRDRGMGMSPETLSQIFKKFYQAPTLKAHSKGVGLGLALVKQVMDGHDGRVEVRSALGKGSTFILLFPLLTLQSKSRGRTSVQHGRKG